MERFDGSARAGGKEKLACRSAENMPSRKGKASINALGLRDLPRIVGVRDVEIKISSPAPGRPVILWHEGNDPDIVREAWSTVNDNPSTKLGSRVNLPFGITKKEVLYLRSRPNVRLVLTLGDPYEREGSQWQNILRSSVERDYGVDPIATRQLEQRLWDEVCQVERRGRPRGTGRPKNMWWHEVDPKRVRLQDLRRLGLDDKDARIFFGLLSGKTGVQIGREMGVSSQAVHNRIKRRIKPRLKAYIADVKSLLQRK